MTMKFRLSSEFGELSPVRNWQPHSGIDLAMPEGTPLRSLGAGVVDRVFTSGDSIGKGLSVKLDDGSRTIYGHMSEVKAQVGDKVNAGQLIGLSGNTGNSTAPHLHFGLKDAEGNVLDPTPFAEPLANISGDHVAPGLIPTLMSNHDSQGLLSRFFWSTGIREKTGEILTEVALGALDVVADLLAGFTLVGSAIMILLKIGGWRDGGRWAGVLVVANILLRALLNNGGA